MGGVAGCPGWPGWPGWAWLVPRAARQVTRTRLAMQPQLAALALAIAGGTSMGIYPAFIKTPAVLAVDVHPAVFQSYKSTMVFLTGFLFLIPRWLAVSHSAEPNQQLYVFSYWGVLSAVCWVPSGISTIFAVPRIGMGMTTAISSATATVLSFLVFWLVFGSKMKSYACGHGCTYYRAPIYLAAVVLGMFGMIFAKEISSCLCRPGVPSSTRTATKPLLASSGSINNADNTISSGASLGRWLAGILVAVSSGTFGACQYAVVQLGHRFEGEHYGCRHNADACPADMKEQFNTFGSWMVSFGIGAIGMAGFVISLVSVRPIQLSDASGCTIAGCPSFHFRVLGPPGYAGVLAGSFWALGNFLITTAVELGGNAVIMAQSLSATIITSGLLGIFWYGEGGSTTSKFFWFVAAIWTLIAMILLGLEKETSPDHQSSESGSGGVY